MELLIRQEKIPIYRFDHSAPIGFELAPSEYYANGEKIPKDKYLQLLKDNRPITLEPLDYE